MRIIYILISAVLAVLSILPWVTLQFNNIGADFLEIITFGLKGIFAAILPSIYALLSLVFAFLLNKGQAKIFLIICSSLFLTFNVVLLVVALMI